MNVLWNGLNPMGHEKAYQSASVSSVDTTANFLLRPMMERLQGKKLLALYEELFAKGP